MTDVAVTNRNVSFRRESRKLLSIDVTVQSKPVTAPLVDKHRNPADQHHGEEEETGTVVDRGACAWLSDNRKRLLLAPRQAFRRRRQAIIEKYEPVGS